MTFVRRSLQVVIAVSEGRVRDFLSSTLLQLEHTILAIFTTLDACCEGCHQLPAVPDIILTDFSELEKIEAVYRNRHASVPFTLITEDTEKLFSDHQVNSVIRRYAFPLTVEQLSFGLQDTMREVERIFSLEKQTSDLEKKLEEQRIVIIAKRIIQERFPLTEDEAYVYLKRLASSRGSSVAPYARELIKHNEFFYPK